MQRYVQRRLVDPTGYPIIKEHWFGGTYNQCGPLELGLRDCKIHQQKWPVVDGSTHTQCNRVLDAIKWNPKSEGKIKEKVKKERLESRKRTTPPITSATTTTTTSFVTPAALKLGHAEQNVTQVMTAPDVAPTKSVTLSFPSTAAQRVTYVVATMTTMNLVNLFLGILGGLGGYGCYVWILTTTCHPIANSSSIGFSDENSSIMWATIHTGDRQSYHQGSTAETIS